MFSWCPAPLCQNKIQFWSLKYSKTCGIIVTCLKEVLPMMQVPNFQSFSVPIFATSDHFSVWSLIEMCPHLINYDYDIANHVANLAKMLHPPGKPWPQSLTLMNFESFPLRKHGLCGCTFKVNTFFFQRKQPDENVS